MFILRYKKAISILLLLLVTGYTVLGAVTENSGGSPFNSPQIMFTRAQLNDIFPENIKESGSVPDAQYYGSGIVAAFVIPGVSLTVVGSYIYCYFMIAEKNMSEPVHPGYQHTNNISSPDEQSPPTVKNTPPTTPPQNQPGAGSVSHSRVKSSLTLYIIFLAITLISLIAFVVVYSRKHR